MKRSRLLAFVLTGIIFLSSFLVTLPVNASGSNSIQNLGPVTSQDVIYQVITDRFYDGDITNNAPSGFDTSLFDGTGTDLKLYQGGDWQGIIDQIPYLKGMGITAVWISAPYENRDEAILDYQQDGSTNIWTSFHGYHVRNYFATNKHFGDLDEFEDLRDALHENGMKLVIDFVTNHTSRYQNPTNAFSVEDGKLYQPDLLPSGEFAFDSNGEPYDYNGDGFVENLIADPNNDVNGWFHHFGDRGNDSSLWGYRNKDLGSLGDFSQENSDVVEHLEKAADFWVSMGIDGIRHDATLHMNPAFVKGLKDNIDNTNTVTQFGEYFIGRPDPKYSDYVYFPKQTGVNNLDFEMYRSLTSTFGNFTLPMSDFANMLTYTQNGYEYVNQTVTFLDNHDVTRFGYIQQNEKPYNVAIAVLMTSRGIPNIYYGTEQYVMPSDASDVAGRVFMQTDCGFDTTTTAYGLIKTLSDLRQENEAIAYGATEILYSDANVMVYERQFYDDVVVVAVNRQPDQTYNLSNIYTSLPIGNYNDVLEGDLFGSGTSVANNSNGNFIESLQLSGGEVSVWSYNSDTSSSPKIGDIVSNMGSAGNTVYIMGEGLDGNVTVKFNDTVATVVSATSKMIETEVPANAVAGANSVTVTKNGVVSNSIIYKVLSGNQNQVIFHVNANTNYGENIYVVGNIPELGSWNVNNCTEVMMNPSYPEWYLPVSVPSGTIIEFKFIKKDANGNVTWEGCGNRVITTSADENGVYNTGVYTWGN